MIENAYSITGIVILVLDIWAIINVINSGSAMSTKILWTLLILFLPLVGLIAWLLAGPRGPTRV